jgi:phosphatidylserine/phosphatidylglycerophosphate/cardiolipin synthase-like enzyme
MINFRANHRKVFLGESGGRMTAIVSSANPHDGSSAHSNVALQITGPIARDIVFTEGAVALFSGGKIGRAPDPRDTTIGTGGDGLAEVVLLTENRIEEAILETIGECSKGDDLWLAMFYLSDRDVVQALLGAAARGVRLRLVLDPNRDAFGYEKKGIPNRPVASELVKKSGGAIAVRWYDTQGEQYHSKMVYAQRANGRATVILGSANLTRRNLDNYNLELDVMVSARADAPPMKDIRDYLERVWSNRGGHYTVEYESFADNSAIRTMIYRFQEFTGLCSF